MIVLDRVSVDVATHEGTSTLLRDISLKLGESRIAIVGANGSGKSTLLRLLNGLLAPSRGTVSVNGLDPQTDGAAVRRMVAFTFTDPFAQLLMSTPVEDVELSLRRVVKDRQTRRARAIDLLTARGLSHLADRSIYELSGGERQLVALTSVLALDPQILVCDEPTTLLDLRHRNEVLAAIMSVHQQLVMATHDLDAAAHCERAIWIDHARVAADGDPAEVIAAYRAACA